MCFTTSQKWIAHETLMLKSNFDLVGGKFVQLHNLHNLFKRPQTPHICTIYSKACTIYVHNLFAQFICTIYLHNSLHNLFAQFVQFAQFIQKTANAAH